ncbi:uncharacterized protein [Nicotiana tomentosiformis]|uniref:uncharacterized protein n=1 Tax=Nicotiana tomentosiformis TaxID=4098 RepID=UPI00388C6FD1
MTTSHLPSLPTFSEEALREARDLKTPDIGGGSSIGDPFRDCFTGVDDASDISDTSILLEEAQRLLSQAFTKFRADLSQCETEFQKVPEERNALKLLCGQKDETIKDLQADLAMAREEEPELDKQVSILLIKYGLDPTVEANTSLSQLQQKVERIELLRREVDQKSSTQAKRIKELETRLAEAKAEIEKTKVIVDKSIAMYRADAEAAEMQLREASDREQ